MNVRGLLVVVGLLAVLLGVALWLWYCNQTRSYAEVVVSPERIEIKETVGRRGKERQLLIAAINHGAGLDKPADPGKHGDPAADFSRLATAYYHQEGPLGIVLE